MDGFQGFIINLFQAKIPTLYPLKTEEYLYSSGVLSGYKNVNTGLKWKNVLRNRREISLQLLNKFNPFPVSVPILYPLKTPENLWFSGVFMAYKMGTLARSGLRKLISFCPP